MNLKRNIIFICIAILVFSSISPAFASSAISEFLSQGKVEMIDALSWEVGNYEVIGVVFGDEDINTNMPSILYPYSGTEYAILPVSSFKKVLNADIDWEQETSMVTIKSGDNVLKFKIGENTGLLNGKKYIFPHKMKARVMRCNGVSSTMLPAGVVRAFGYDYTWNTESRTIEINYPKQIVTDVLWDESGRFSEIHIPVSGEVLTASYYVDGSEFGQSDKIIVDLQNTTFKLPEHKLNKGKRTIDFLYGDIKKIVAYGIKSDSKTRIEIEVEQRKGYDVFYDSKNKQIVIRFINSVRDVHLEEIYSTPTVVINAGEFPAYNVIRLNDKIVVDVMNSLMKYADGKARIDEINYGGVKSISYSQYDTKYDPNYDEQDIVSRVVINLEKGISSEDIYIENEDNEIYVYISGNPLDGVDYAKIGIDSAVLSMNLDNTAYVTTKYDKKNNLVTFDLNSNSINLSDMDVDLNDGLIESIKIKANDSNNKHRVYVKLANGTKLSNPLNGDRVSSIELKFVNEKLKNSIWKNTLVVIDAGHGGKDPGAVGSKVTESVLTLRAAKTLRRKLDGLGFKTYMIRDADVTIARSYRKRISNEIGADLVISIHFNASTNPNSKGIEVLYADEPTGRKKKLASILQRHLIRTLNMVDRGIVHRPNLYMCYAPKMPSVLIELGFVTNEEEQNRIMTQSYMEDATGAIVRGILEFLRGY